MYITHCTITGADDNTDIADLIKLSSKYPFVEWGILVGSQEGLARFPSQKWIGEFKATGLHYATHFCGKRLRDYLDYNTVNYAHNGMTHGRRIQLNFGDITPNQRLIVHAKATQNQSVDFILPLKERTKDLWVMGQNAPNINFLFDSSGGRGLEPVEWPTPIAGIKCGYAGGLGPEEIYGQLAALDMCVGEGFIWIDMETRVRTDEKLDIQKVEEVLTCAAKYRILP